MAISYVHPSVSSTITDNSSVYITASGTTKLFAVFTSEKGVDNEIKTITTASEFIFNYGEPNMKLYGQTGYNIVNWLNAGGVVYCLRVLPDDAGYANAIVNIQTKVGKKQVLDVNGELVDVDDVQLRPCITYTNINNTSKSAIEFDELRRSSMVTVDGYTNNMLFAVIPKGRGKNYNNLGFRISLTDSYDSTYEFRLYNFEVTKTSDTGSVSTIQGPFLVSLDPDAMSLSGSSLFIADVIESYCDYFTVIFNEDNYESLAKIINPEIHPNKIDFFNGESRMVNGEYETYYDKRTGKEEDIHMAVIKYDINGVATDERNIINANNTVERNIVEVDNAYRTSQYDRHEKSFDRIKTALGIVRKIEAGTGTVDNFTNIEIETIKDEGNVVTLGKGIDILSSDKAVEDAYAEFIEAKDNLSQSDLGLEELLNRYSIADNKMYKLSTSVDSLLDKLYEIFDYARIGQSVDTSYATKIVDIISDLDTVENYIENINVIALNCNKYLTIASDLLETYNKLSLSAINSEKESFIFDVINEVGDIVYALKNISSKENIFADAKLNEIENTLNNLKSAYDILIDEYTTNNEYKLTLDGVTDDIGNTSGGVWNEIKELLSIDSGINFVINLALLECKAEAYINVQPTLGSLKNDVLSLFETIKTNISGFKYDSAKLSVISLDNDLKKKSQNKFVTILQDFNSFANLLYGTDGSIENASYKDKSVEKLIIAGYTGSIDPSLTDKDKWPIDLILDANYSADVKNAIATLCTEYRDDFMGILDTELQSSPEAAINYRKNSINYNNFRLAIFTQDFVISDTQYTGNVIQVTPTYFLASKIPANDNANGIHWNFVGPRRGVVSGYKAVSFLPNPQWRERLYNAQINYVQEDQTSTRFNSQLTSQHNVSALSNISCVRTLLRIQRDVEDLMKNYQFEFNDDVTITNAQVALNSYLNQWLSNRACDTITGTVYASDYDRQQKLVRVKIELTFNSIIERIAIDLIVNS